MSALFEKLAQIDIILIVPPYFRANTESIIIQYTNTQSVIRAR